MAIGTLYISHNNYDFSNFDSQLLDSKNLKNAVESKTVSDYHTSVEDCGIKIGKIAEELLMHCQSIVCVDWSWDSMINLENHPSYAQVAYLLSTKFNNSSSGLDKFFKETVEQCTHQRATRKSNKPPLWVAGCSWSSAVGVDPTERWGHLVATELGLEEVNIAQGGASIWDASDQILRADIRKDDTVVWGLTSAGRVDFINDTNQLRSYPVKQASTVDYFNIDYFFSNTQYLIAMRQIQQVISHCAKIGTRLYIVNFLDQGWFPFMLNNHTNFLDLQHEFVDESMTYKMIDYGTDREHPGPKQHQEYAKEITKFIQ